MCDIISLSFDKELPLYDNLIPDFFGVPANFGGPTILETAFEWIIFEPEGTVEKFSADTGVPVEIVKRYWKRLQLLAVLDEEHRTFGNVAKEWLNRHPDGNISSFLSELRLRRSDINKLRLSPDNPFSLRSDVNPAIIKWFEEHPDGTLTACANETGVSYSYIARNYESLGIRNRKERIAERDARIVEWIENHPEQTGKEIASHCNVKPCIIGDIKRKLKQCADSGTPVTKTYKTKEKGLTKDAEHIERMSAWIETHKPYGTRDACAKDLGLNKATVCNLWEKAGGKARSVEDLKSEARLLAIVTWMAEHPGAKDIDCALALKDMGVNVESLRVHKSQISRIAKWRTAHSEGSQEACAQDLNFSLRKVVNMWPSATVWMEHMM